MMEQLILIEIAAPPDPEQVRCSQCAAELYDLDDLHQRCPVTGIIHETATITDRNTLYRHTHQILLI
ncbi:MAG: hypothetical protein WBV94_13845 [Blastocatellia bacterium]